MSASHPDALIVGGGVIGLGIASELARRGARVRVLERNAAVGCEASWAAAGFLHQRVTTQDAYGWLSREGLARYPAWADDLLERTGIDIGFRPRGGLELAFSPEKRASLPRFLLMQQRRGLGARWLEPSEVRDMEPAVSESVLGGVFFPHDAQVRPPRLLRALNEAARGLGAEVVTNAPVDGILSSPDGSVVGAAAGGVEHQAGTTVLTAGCWSGQIDGGVRLPVRPVRGQMLRMSAPDGLLSRTVNADGAYVVQRDDGTLIVGSTQEEVGFDKSTTEDGIESLRSGAIRAFPALADERVLQTWAGLRPAPARRFPYIAELRPGLWVATGHFRTGILLAPSTAHVVATAILDGVSPVNLDDFHPDRDARSVRGQSKGERHA